MKNSSTRSRSAGFTLLELAAVVTIIGILATIAVYSVTRYLRYAKTAEAAEIIGAIKAGEEAYFDEAHRYLSAHATSKDSFYPDSPGAANAAGDTKIQWGADPGTCSGCVNQYRVLGVMPAAAVIFRYATTAGVAGGNPQNSLPNTVTDTTIVPSSAGTAYFVVTAQSDLSVDGSPFTTYVGTNLQDNLLAQNVGE